MLARIPRGVVLDVAAGRGRNALALARAGMTVVAVDFSAEAMRLLAATARDARLAIWPVVANLDSFHLKDESFDAIVNINFLDRALFPKFVRALRPGGVLIADTFLVDQAAHRSSARSAFSARARRASHARGRPRDRRIPRRPGHLSKRRARLSRVDSRAAEEIDLMAPGMTYKEAGVDIALKQSLIPLFGSIAKTTSGAHVIGGVGGFGALVGLNGARKMRAPVLVAGTDSVGTKLMIAFADRASRHRRHRLRRDVRQRHHLPRRASAVLSRLHRLGQARKENRARYRQGRRPRMRSGRHEPGRRRNRAAQRIVQARRVRPGRLRGRNRRARANPRAVERARPATC